MLSGTNCRCKRDAMATEALRKAAARQPFTTSQSSGLFPPAMPGRSTAARPRAGYSKRRLQYFIRLGYSIDTSFRLGAADAGRSRVRRRVRAQGSHPLVGVTSQGLPGNSHGAAEVSGTGRGRRSSHWRQSWATVMGGSRTRLDLEGRSLVDSLSLSDCPFLTLIGCFFTPVEDLFTFTGC